MDKKHFLNKSILIFFFAITATVTNAQQNVYVKIADNYFRANPFDREYSKFLVYLMNDPALVNKSITRRTDTTLFTFHADYKNFSPYSFAADRTEINLQEKEIEIGDSVSVLDTMFIYQVIGYKMGKDGLEGVKKEYSKFNRKFKNDFFSDQQSNIIRNEQVVGEITSYFTLGTDTAPVSVSWAKVNDNQYFFSIVFRFKIRQNITILPIAPEGR